MGESGTARRPDGRRRAQPASPDETQFWQRPSHFRARTKRNASWPIRHGLTMCCLGITVGGWLAGLGQHPPLIRGCLLVGQQPPSGVWFCPASRRISLPVSRYFLFWGCPMYLFSLRPLSSCISRLESPPNTKQTKTLLRISALTFDLSSPSPNPALVATCSTTSTSTHLTA